MANPASYAISLGLLIAVLAAILAATRRTPAMAGAAVPLLAAVGDRRPSRRTGTGRATTRKGTGTGKANGTGKTNGNGKATRAGNSQTTAAPPSTPRRAKAEPGTAPAVNPVSGTQRLAPGKLQEQVLAYLAEHAGQELSPSHIAKALGRSSGAVGNGLESLAKEGEIQKTQETPRRFMIPARGTAKRNAAGRRNGTGQPTAPAAPKPTRASRGTRKAGNGPNATTSNGKGNGGNGAKAEPPAASAPSEPAAKPSERRPATRRGRNNKAGAAADEAAATGK
jgi:hypothetical protein